MRLLVIAKFAGVLVMYNSLKLHGAKEVALIA
jgi:hypothetical protein